MAAKSAAPSTLGEILVGATCTIVASGRRVRVAWQHQGRCTFARDVDETGEALGEPTPHPYGTWIVDVVTREDRLLKEVL